MAAPHERRRAARPGTIWHDGSVNTTTRTIRSLLLASLAVLLSACGAIPRHAVPKDLVDQAHVPGMEMVRFWGDVDDPRIEEAFKQSIEREMAATGQGGAPVLSDSSFLALSGGGSNGAYGAGILCGWTQRGDRPSFKIVTGISTGALIAPFAFLGSKYDDVLREVYTSVSTEDIATSRGLLGGLLSDAMADNTPLRKIVDKYVTPEILAEVAEETRKGRILIIATTNLDAERPVIWSMGRIANAGTPQALQLFRDILVASAAIPGVFPPVMVKVEAGGKPYDEMHCDGGVTAQVFLYPAAFSFKEVDQAIGIQRSRTVYVIRNAQLTSVYMEVPRRLLPILGRTIDALIKTQGIGDLYRIYLGCKRDGLAYRLAFIPPDFDAVSAEPFDPVYMQKLFDRGFEQAKNGYPWADSPPGFDPPKAD